MCRICRTVSSLLAGIPFSSRVTRQGVAVADLRSSYSRIRVAGSVSEAMAGFNRNSQTRVERYAGQCSCCGSTILAPVQDGLEEGSPFGPSIVAMALDLRFTHTIRYRHLCSLFEHLLGLRSARARSMLCSAAPSPPSPPPPS